MTEGSPDYGDEYLTVADGLRLHYRDFAGAADKPPLLCLHGLTRNARSFDNLAARIAPRRRVIALDFRGRGLSDYDPQPERYTPLIYSGDVLHLLDELAIGEAVFLGTSLGGLVTMAIAAMAPERIKAGILNDVGPDVAPGGVDRILTYVGKDRRFANWDEAAAAVEAAQGSQYEKFGRDDWVAMAKRNCREENGEIRFDYDMAIAEPFKSLGATPAVDLWPFFEALAQKPLLVIRGEKSDLLTPETAAKMQRVAPQMKLATVPGVGHAPELDEPVAAAAIEDFLGSLSFRGKASR
jgi:pimeloyl-ACP methyl ester carboxylesterase